MSSFGARLLGAARLDAATYEELENDRSANLQALGVVVLASLAAGIGSFRTAGLGGLVFDAIVALLAWGLWAVVTYFAGVHLLPEPETRSDMGELLRTIGFSSTPGLLRVFGNLPRLTVPVSVLAEAWMLVAMVVAVRQALDYRSTLRAVAVCLIGFLAYVAVTRGLMLALFALGALGTALS
jgi:hypothetical protein